MLAAILIFAATYLVMGIGRMPGLRIDGRVWHWSRHRTGAAIAGASMMAAANLLTFDDAWAAIDSRHASA
jgi:hypothetical protein